MKRDAAHRTGYTPAMLSRCSLFQTRRATNGLPVAVVVGVIVLLSFMAQARAQGPGDDLDARIRADMGFLASDELHGRGSATRDELLAAEFCAKQMMAMNLKPGAPDGSFILRAKVPLAADKVAANASRAAGGVPVEDVSRAETYDAVAVLPGSDPALKDQAILLTAHLDHLGMEAANGPDADKVFNGADDDASGTTAVLTLMRRLAGGPAPKRTVIFALFGSEELGGYGNQAFMAQPPVPLDHIVVNLEFEMIGRPDPLVPEGTLWLTGFERSNLGPELASHGAHLVADPHPKEQFFRRSDNFALAQRGVVAQTVSSFGLHKDYHRVSDDLAHIDFAHMATAIRSMEGPVDWLVNTDWKPSWTVHGRP